MLIICLDQTVQPTTHVNVSPNGPPSIPPLPGVNHVASPENKSTLNEIFALPALTFALNLALIFGRGDAQLATMSAKISTHIINFRHAMSILQIKGMERNKVDVVKKKVCKKRKTREKQDSLKDNRFSKILALIPNC
jgi:hypothetical protein